MDIIVKQANASTWAMFDLLGRNRGEVVEHPEGQFTIATHDIALGTTSGLRLSGFKTLDDALAEVERHTCGTCRLAASGAEGPEPEGEA